MRRCLFAVFLSAMCSFSIAAQQALNNDAVIKLVKAGLSDDVILTTINASPGSYNTAADDLTVLKAAGVSDKVISAMVLKSPPAAPAGESPTAPAADSPAASSIPLLGIYDVGVYFKDKTGSWIPLVPEVAHFKGNTMKNFISARGDISGHLDGPRAKETLSFPIRLAVRVPEGIAITDYQLLRLHSSSGSRSFRAVNGGATRGTGGTPGDLVGFQPEQLASHVYQISLDAALGKGEYGLLPPAAVGTPDTGSSAKIYSISILQ